MSKLIGFTVSGVVHAGLAASIWLHLSGAAELTQSEVYTMNLSMLVQPVDEQQVISPEP
ncbi:MAG: hypothetical protein HKP55_11840, partial [Gammaproteobacteria bacterium]|nr:hypothetical protein [Gammaproteobacteria bacterium]